MRFVGRKVFVEPVDLQVFVIVVRAALDASLRKFDVLECMSVITLFARVEIDCVRHVDDIR